MAAKQTAEKSTTEKVYEISNESQVVVSSGQIRIMPKGVKGSVVRVAESKISEGLKRLLNQATGGLKMKLIE